MPRQTPYPSGAIAVKDARLRDISTGMNWNMPDAREVRFLAVSGTLWVGDCRTTYDFTLVEYHLYIDEVSWIIFSTLNNVEQEFAPEFWDIVNYNRKERWCRKSAVHRSAVRSNASSKFLQNYAGGRVRQPRTPNTSAERKFTNLIKLKQYRVKRIVSPLTPTC